MRRLTHASAGPARLLVSVLLGMATAACSDQQPVASREPPDLPSVRTVQTLDCTGSITAATLSCRPARGGAGRASAVILGGQGTNVQLTSSNVSYDPTTDIFQFDITLQNLLNEAIGTPDGTTADPEGIRIYFSSGPTVTSGTGTVYVNNADGEAIFTDTSTTLRPYFSIYEILAKNQVSSPRTWELEVPSTVEAFSFTLRVETDVQYLLVINEVMVNPGGTITDANGEWFEVYNAGSRAVQMQGLVIADSSGTGRRPYHVIGSSLSIPSGGYVTLGPNSSTTSNGGVTIDYVYPYATAPALANNFDALKIARVYGTDTLTLDRVSFANGAVSAQNGISRELKNPSLDNANMDGSNWADALSTAVYGAGGRGTPKAQSSTYTP